MAEERARAAAAQSASGVVAWPGCVGDAGLGADGEALAFDDIGAGEGFDDAAGEGRGAGRIALAGKADGEFGAGEAGEQILLAQEVGEAAGGDAQNGIGDMGAEASW